jgi:glutaminyl-peptide cyclotransferase
VNRSIVPIIVACCISACSEKPAAPPAEQSARVAVSPELWKEFSGEKALEETRRQVEIGPRPSGSSAIEKARQHITETLVKNGWEAERQEFRETPVPGRGEVVFANIIARFPAAKGQPASRATQRVIIGSHFDTKILPIRFVGANDAGSSTGALLELSRVLAVAPTFAAQFELVFFDGEEAVVNFGSAEAGPDGLVGSRYYAKQVRDRARQFRFAIVWDMVGDKDLTVTLPSDTPANLSGGIFTAAEQLGFRSKFGFASGPILDDHEPIARIARIPAIDIIDFNYTTTENQIWHTAADTMDKLSAESLEIVGRTTLKMLINELGAK